MLRYVMIGIVLLGMGVSASGATYYLDASAVGPVFDGSQASPWQTVEQMQQFFFDKPGHGSGDTVLIDGGEYGDFVDGAYAGDGFSALQNAQLPRTDWLKLKAADINDRPIFRHLRMYGARDVYLELDGLHVISRTPHVYSECVHMRNGIRHIRLLNLEIEAEDDMLQLPSGIFMTYNNPTDILIEGCEVHHVDTAMPINGNDIVFRNNEIHHIASSGVKSGGGLNMLVEGNHIHHQVQRIIRINLYGDQVGTFTMGESITQPGTGAHATVYRIFADRLEVTPDNKVVYEFVTGQPVYSDDTSNAITSVTDITHADLSHGSGLSVRTNGYTARFNRIHDYGSTAGIFVYPIGTPYSNMLFENNLVYDAITRTVVFNDIGDNFVCRNNTFVGGVDAYFYDGYDGSGLKLYNNIFKQLTAWYQDEIDHIQEGNNIAMYVNTRSPWSMDGNFGAGSSSVLLGYDAAGTQAFNDLFVDAAGLDFHLAEGSMAIDFGDPAHAPAVDFDGNDRDVLPDTGAYEYDNSGARVMGRYVFYNNSSFDGGDADVNAADDAAIATDKLALRYGETATFANYTSYDKGINGVMIDILGATAPGSLSASDFELTVGEDSSVDFWPPAPGVVGVTVREGAGIHGSDRVTILFADGAITGKWLNVKVLPTANTGLAHVDAFFFGNAIGETGNSASDAVVDATDEIGARNNPRHFMRPALIDDAHDFNRDGKVDATDEILARNHVTTVLTGLQLISP